MTESITSKVLKQNCGADVSKSDFKICLYELMGDLRKRIKGRKKFKNTLKGFTALTTWLSKKQLEGVELRITMEATGVYYESLAHYLHEQGFTVCVILPNKSKAYGDSLNLKTRTDKTEAEMLGQMGLERDLEVWQPASPQMRKLKQLTRERVRLQTEKTRLSNQRHALQHSHDPDLQGVKRLQQRIKLIQKQLKQVDKQIVQTIKADQVLEARIARICEVKGLGITTVATIIAETNGFRLFTSRAQLVSWSGYDITKKESGSSVKSKERISKKGNKYIRRALYFPAITAAAKEVPFQQLFERCLERSNIKMKAYVAVQRKLLLLIYALYKSGQKYDPNYHNQHKNQHHKVQIEQHELIQNG